MKTQLGQIATGLKAERGDLFVVKRPSRTWNQSCSGTINGVWPVAEAVYHRQTILSLVFGSLPLS
jgi:hypothetical protein